MSSNVIGNISLDLAIKVAKMCQILHNEGRQDIVAEHLLNSCVAVGVCIRDYEYEQNITSMIESLNLALKELRYATYWLDLICEISAPADGLYDDLLRAFTDLRDGIKETIAEMA